MVDSSWATSLWPPGLQGETQWQPAGLAEAEGASWGQAAWCLWVEWDPLPVGQRASRPSACCGRPPHVSGEGRVCPELGTCGGKTPLLDSPGVTRWWGGVSGQKAVLLGRLLC